MKIIYLHQYFNTPQMKGSTRSYEMARRMVMAGHEVHIITSSRNERGRNASWRVEEIDGIYVHWLSVPYDNSMAYRQRIQAFFKFALKAGDRAIQVGGDVIFASSTPLTIALPAVKAKKKLKIPMVFEVRDLWPEIPIALGALKSPITKYLARKLEAYAYNHAAKIIALSPGMRDGVLQTGYSSSDVTVIPNSSDLNEFCVPYESQKQFRYQYEWLEDRKFVLYAGTLGKVNGVSYFVELAKHALSINPDLRFVIIGDGVEQDLVRQKAEDAQVLHNNLFMLPQVSKSQITAAFAAADAASSWVINNPVLWENSANKFFDSLAAGTPIVINHEGWQAHMIREENIGLVLPVEVTRESTERLNQFLCDEDRVKEYGQNARKLAEVYFSRDLLAQQLIGVLEAVHNSQAQPNQL